MHTKRGGRHALDAVQRQHLFYVLRDQCNACWAAVLFLLQLCIGDRCSAALAVKVGWLDISPTSGGPQPLPFRRSEWENKGKDEPTAGLLKPTGSWEDVYRERQIARAYCLYLVKLKGWNSGFVVLHGLLSKPRRWFVASLRIRDPKVADQGGVVFQLKYWQCSGSCNAWMHLFHSRLEVGQWLNCNWILQLNIWQMLNVITFPVCLIKAVAIHRFRNYVLSCRHFPPVALI